MFRYPRHKVFSCYTFVFCSFYISGRTWGNPKKTHYICAHEEDSFSKYLVVITCMFIALGIWDLGRSYWRVCRVVCPLGMSHARAKCSSKRHPAKNCHSPKFIFFPPIDNLFLLLFFPREQDDSAKKMLVSWLLLLLHGKFFSLPLCIKSWAQKEAYIVKYFV